MSKLEIIALNNGLCAKWHTQTATTSLELRPQEGSQTAWRLLKTFECSTMDGPEITLNSQNLAMDTAMQRFAKFCNEDPEE